MKKSNVVNLSVFWNRRLLFTRSAAIILILIILILIPIVKVSAQQSLNFQPDTSFTSLSAYQKAKKSYPAIRIAGLNDSAGTASKATTTKPHVLSVKNIIYSTVNGRTLALDIFFPADSIQVKLPAVLMIHGGGWRSGNRFMHIPMAEKLASQGYITITAEYRLSVEALYPAAVNDLKTALKWIRANAVEYHIDENKIAVWGFSAGGQLAALIGTTNNSPLYKGNEEYRNYSDEVQAIIDVDGTLAFIHPESGEGDDREKPSAATLWFGSSKTARPELWQQASPLNHVSSTTAPILFINSAIERMHAGRNDMIKKLSELHIDHEVHTFENTPHTFILFHPWFDPAADLTVKFLNRILKSGPAVH